VVQGANDPRVNQREAEQIVIALRDRGLPVEYMLAPDEGHGYARPVNNMAMFMAAEKFFAQQMDGRYQEGGTPEVVARLKEIMVDPKTVVLSKKMDAAAVGTPQPATELHAGTWKYQVKLSIGGQDISVARSTTITEAPDGFTAVDTVDTPAGSVTDSATLDKTTLVPRQRTVKQGPATVNVDFAGDKASGSINMNGKDTPIAVDLGGSLFADGPGAPQVIACLPLADGYSTTYRNVDLQKQKVKLMQLKVAGSESVTVPAGTFDAYKVEISDDSSGKMTLWIAKQTQAAVKIATTLPEMGGAQMTAELAP
jgi:hypothetical protein